MSRIIAAAEDAPDMRRRMGAAALDMDAASDSSAIALARDRGWGDDGLAEVSALL